MMVKFLVCEELALPARSVQLTLHLWAPSGRPDTMNEAVTLLGTPAMVWLGEPSRLIVQFAVGEMEV